MNNRKRDTCDFCHQLLGDNPRILKEAGEKYCSDECHNDALREQVARQRWPTPTSPRPSIEDLGRWMFEGGCEATDGCWVEPDGHCPHGYPSWLLVLGLI